MSKPVMRTYKDINDLKKMQKLTQQIWSFQSNYHIGDLAWQRYQHVGRENEWNTAIWEIDHRPVAWGWIKRPGNLLCQVDPEYPEICYEVIDWFNKTAESEELRVNVLETEFHLITALKNTLFTPISDTLEILMKISLENNDPFPVQLPKDYYARHIKGVQDIKNRVDVHRSAFHPSKVTEESYLNVMNAYPYDSSLDWVIESPKGKFAAFCLIWFDEVNKVGLLEPVGTDPRFRRLGLASSVCKSALNALKKKGAKTAVVVSMSQESYKLYKSIGFEKFAQALTFQRTKQNE